MNLIRRNIDRNKEIMQASLQVKEIDFFNHDTIKNSNGLKKDVTILLAADGINAFLK